MKAYVFPGQGSQFTGMGKDLYDNKPKARELMDVANDILGFGLTKIMFEGSADELVQTRVTQPAIFVHSVAMALSAESFAPDMLSLIHI
jgi:[acyl-carrier-protein] S-malonyltransferase